MVLLTAAFLVLMFLLRNQMAWNVLLSAAYAFSIGLVLYRMKKQTE